MKRIIQFLAFCLLPATGFCQEKGLKDYYQGYFTMGVAVAPQHMDLARPEAKLILEHFQSMTPENVMKMGPIHPEPDRFNWEPADKIVTFAQDNGLKMRGHCLCWHSQAPRWFFTDADGKDVSRDVLLKRLEEHISSVAGRYKGQIYAWDVVNEAISDKENEFLRPSKFVEIIGEDFIEKAFEFAHKADPEAKLFYNDYNVISEIKREKIYKLVKGLKDKGIPIHGVGVQGHWSIYEPTKVQLEATIDKFTDLGLDVQITELDVSVYPKEHGRREKREDDISSFTPKQEQLQIDQYKMIFDVFRERKDNISVVTFWNISDNRSWLDNFPIRGRKDYPLLFDTEFKPKKAYYELVKDLQKKSL